MGMHKAKACIFVKNAVDFLPRPRVLPVNDSYPTKPHICVNYTYLTYLTPNSPFKQLKQCAGEKSPNCSEAGSDITRKKRRAITKPKKRFWCLGIDSVLMQVFKTSTSEGGWHILPEAGKASQTAYNGLFRMKFDTHRADEAMQI